MSNIVIFNGITSLDYEPEQILNAAIEKGLSQAVVIGYDEDGEFYFSSSLADGGDVIWLLEMAKKKLLEIVD